MKFELLENNTIKCIVNRSELKDFEVELEDIAEQNDKAKAFVMKMISMAETEVGYHTESSNFFMQARTISNDEIMFTVFDNKEKIISEFKEKYGEALVGLIDGLMEKANEEKSTMPAPDVEKALREKIDNHISDLAEQFLLEKKKLHDEKIVKEKEIQVQPNCDDGVPQNRTEALQEEKKEAQKGNVEKGGKAAEKPVQTVICFPTLNELYYYLKCIPDKMHIGSSLYKEDNHEGYALLIEGYEEYTEDFTQAYFRAVECSALIKDEDAYAVYLKEHAECLIAEHAVEKLQMKTETEYS